jgi:hypothetical protein
MLSLPRELRQDSGFGNGTGALDRFRNVAIHAAGVGAGPRQM